MTVPEAPEVAALRSAVATADTNDDAAKVIASRIADLDRPVPVLADAIRAGVIAVEMLTDKAGLRGVREQVITVLRDRARAERAAAALTALAESEVGIGVIAIGTDDPEAAIAALRAEHPLDVVLTRPGDGYYVTEYVTEVREVTRVVNAKGEPALPGEQGTVVTESIEEQVPVQVLVHDVIEERLADGDDDRFVIHDGHLYARGFTSERVQAALTASRR